MNSELENMRANKYRLNVNEFKYGVESVPLTFNNFCRYACDGMYTPGIPEKEQCTGYKKLKEMVVNQIEPASLEEMERWEKNPTQEELWSVPDIKYMRFIHPNLRPFIIHNWNIIKDLEIETDNYFKPMDESILQ